MLISFLSPLRAGIPAKRKPGILNFWNPGLKSLIIRQTVLHTTIRRITAVSTGSGFLQHATTHHTHTCCCDNEFHRMFSSLTLLTGVYTHLPTMSIGFVKILEFLFSPMVK